ncbi:hypothetical protein [uncultured Actinomyces sp.]|uniref:hypothetical protein n=1 Tax=uncultured Actinomyces sp. TaxID=249061 RepID=UPI0028DB57A9|nr:hypothetical protein [uncultured Actinomyces sp.]
MDATSTTRAGTEPVDLSGVPETMLPLCARAQHTLSPRPRFQDHDAVTLVSRLDHDVAAARTGRPTAEGTARALTQHLPVLRARRAPRPRTGGRALPYGVRGLQNPASHFRTGGRDQGPVTGQTGERP